MALFADGKNDEALAIDKDLLTETPDHPKRIFWLVKYWCAATTLPMLKPISKRSAIPDRSLCLACMPFWEKFTLRQIGFLKLCMSSKWARPATTMAVFTISLVALIRRLGDKEKADEAFRVSKQLRDSRMIARIPRNSS